MELKQKRFVYEKAFSVEGIIQNLKTYQVAAGEAEPSILCKRKHGSSGESVGSSAATERKRRRRIKYKQRREMKKKRESEDTSSVVGEEKEDSWSSSTERHTSTSPGESRAAAVGGTGPAGSLGLVQYSSSEGEGSSSHGEELSSDLLASQTLPVPKAILGMYVGEDERGEKEGEEEEEEREEMSSCSGLGFFQPHISSSDEEEEDDKEKQRERMTHKATTTSTTVMESAGREKWDAVKAKWKFPVSKLQTHVCANCGKIGHFTQDCTVGAPNQEPPKIPTNLKTLYSKAHKLGRSKDIHCSDCGITTNLVCCLDCRSVHCDGRGHLTAHLLSHPTHNSLFSCKLRKVIKCSNSQCQTVSIYDLYICSHCLGNAFSHHYSMVTACWSSSGLRKIQNAIACEDHFHWHRVNCPSSAEENFATRDKLQQATLSEFFF